ncbi:hypothetical protein BDW59DRAFT_170164 [Aspergillus cavernicola]|uniref:RBR-type E3 ubiquitin transferase n=1 Tax=Aspergillus cavernicola TaxID=176166 RepID=A0ABR4IR25_9EURO
MVCLPSASDLSGTGHDAGGVLLGRRRSWELALDGMLDDLSRGSNSASSIEPDVDSLPSPVSPPELFPTPDRHDMTPQLEEGSFSTLLDAISPLENNLPWSDSCWSDATTAGAVLSLLHKEPLDPPSNSTHEREYTSRTRLTCSVCLEVLEPEQYPDTPIAAECDHTSISSTHICTICLSRSLDIQFSNSRVPLLRCPLCRASLSDNEVERWASTPAFLAYDIARTRRVLEEDAEFVMCIKPDCGYGQLHAGGVEDPIVVCAACGTRTCFTHQEIPWHDGLTCAELEVIGHPSMDQENQPLGLSAALRVGGPRQGRAASEELLSQRTIQQTTRACPGCYVATEKVGGCKYMRCEMCWQEWCWDCSNFWDRGHLGVDCSIFIFSNEQ